MVNRLLLWICLLAALLVSAEERAVHIIHTSDLHGHIERDADSTGMLCISAAIRDIRTQAGAGNSLYIDSGDTVQGTLDASLTRGMLPLQVLRAMGCDVWVPGNHEFDFGMQRFGDFARYMLPVMLCGNLRPADTAQAAYPAWRLFRRNGVSIAVIGMTASYLAHWYQEEFGKNYTVELAQTALERLMPEVLAAKPDAIILAIHQGWSTPQQDPRGVNEVAAIAASYPEIDLILGGHTHRPFPGMPVGAGCWYMQPAGKAQHFGHAVIYCDTDAHKVTRIESVLVAASACKHEDASLRKTMAAQLGQLKELAEHVVRPSMPCTITADGIPGKDNAMSELFCQALCAAAKTPLALHGVLSRKALEAGKPVTEEEIYQVVPYENTIVVAHFTKEELEEVLSEQWSFRKHYSYCGFYGAKVTFGKDGKAHVSELPEADSDGRYALAMNSFTAAGGGRYNRLVELLALPSSKTVDTDISTRDAMRSFIRKLPPK